MKKCTSCKVDKPFSDFNKCKSGKHGLHNHCRVCQKRVRRDWYLRNQQAEKRKSKEYASSEKGKQSRKQYVMDNYEVVLERNRLRRRQEKAKVKQRANERQRYRTDIDYRIGKSLRTRLNKALRGLDKSASTLQLLGCSVVELKKHLESQFQDGMTWENQGYYGWHIDHIIPCDSFDLSNLEEQRKCFHHTNLRPLWREENQSKGNRLVA